MIKTSHTSIDLHLSFCPYQDSNGLSIQRYWQGCSTRSRTQIFILCPVGESKEILVAIVIIAKPNSPKCPPDWGSRVGIWEKDKNEKGEGKQLQWSACEREKWSNHATLKTTLNHF